MTLLVLDSGGLTDLASNRARLHALLDARAWPPEVPAVVLAEALTGDPRRDHAVDRLLGLCTVVVVDEPVARRAAALRFQARKARAVSAVDAVVAAHAESRPGSVVITGDPRDLQALADVAQPGFAVRAV